jgi:hypothetical protein
MEKAKLFLKKIFTFSKEIFKKPKSQQHEKTKQTIFLAFRKMEKSFNSTNSHVLKLFVVLISTQQRGDVVSNGVHMAIAVSATEHIAAGQTKVYTPIYKKVILFKQINF